MSKRTDILHGRRGGRFVPDGYEQTDFANARHCDVCDGLMVVGQRQRHHACDPETMVAERCTCRPDCTRDLVGDGPTPCAADCVPCRIQRNRLHREVIEWSRSR